MRKAECRREEKRRGVLYKRILNYMKVTFVKKNDQLKGSSKRATIIRSKRRGGQKDFQVDRPKETMRQVEKKKKQQTKEQGKKRGGNSS